MEDGVRQGVDTARQEVATAQMGGVHKVSGEVIAKVEDMVAHKALEEAVDMRGAAMLVVEVMVEVMVMPGVDMATPGVDRRLCK